MASTQMALLDLLTTTARTRPLTAPFVPGYKRSQMTGVARPENSAVPGIGRDRSFCDPDVALSAAFSTALGSLVIADCLSILSQIPDDSLDLVVTSPPYDGQPKYGNGERYERDWYEGFFLKVTAEVLRTLKPHGSFVLNYRSKRHGDERGTLQYELVFRLREQGFLFCEDFIWGKPSPPPGRFNRFLKDAVEYCFQFAKTPKWQFFPEHSLTPARWDAKDRERRKKLAHNYVRVNEPSGQGRKRVQAGPDMVRPSTLLRLEPDFTPNPTGHPARFPLQLPTFFIKLMTRPGQLGVRSVRRDRYDGGCRRASRTPLACHRDRRKVCGNSSTTIEAGAIGPRADRH